VCTPSANKQHRKEKLKEKETARLKQWETKQAVELEKCVKLTQNTCGCTLADRKPYSTLLSLKYYVQF